MLFDEALTDVLGEFGTFSKRILALVCLEQMFFSFQVMSAVFLTWQPQFWCAPPHASNLGNCSRSVLDNLTVPWKVSDGEWEADHCRMYDRNYSSIADPQCTVPSSMTNASVVCTQWTFDESERGETIVTEWGTVCSRAWMASTVGAVFLGGRAVGNLIFGWLADRFGRKKVILGSGITNLAAGVACALAPSYTFFVVVRFLHSCLATGKTNAGFVMGLEMCGPSWRVFSGSMYMITWAVAFMGLAGIAYLERFLSWRWLLATLLIPEVVYYPLVYFFMTESPRWLYLKGRKEEADKVVEEIAKINKVTLPKGGLNIIEKNDTSNRSPWDLVRTPGIRMLSINMFYNWAANGFVYYGLSMNTGNLGGNTYLNYAISGAVEIPAYIFIIWSFKRLGRIWPYTLSMVIGGIAMLLIAAVPSGTDWAIITLAMIGKFFISASFAMAWIYSGEVYPTCIRNLGITVTGIAARLSSPLSPYIALLGEKNEALPYIIFGALSLSAGLLVLFLPETKGVPMPQTIEDGEQLIKNNTINLRFWRNPKASNESSSTTDITKSIDDVTSNTRF